MSRRLRRLSTNSILVSKPELKHTSDKVTITIYLYNRQKTYLLNRLKKINSIFNFFKLLDSDSRRPALLSRKKTMNRKLSKEILKSVKERVKGLILKVSKEKKIFTGTSDKAEKMVKENQFTRPYGENSFLKNLVSKSLGKEMLSLFFMQILYFNRSKFNSTYLAAFTRLIKKVLSPPGGGLGQKDVSFNLVNLKYLHLNSYIFTETLATKLRNKKNKLLRVLTAALSRFKVPVENKLATFDDIYNRSKTKQNLMLKDFSLAPLGKLAGLRPAKDMLQEMLEKSSLRPSSDTLTCALSSPLNFVPAPQAEEEGNRTGRTEKEELIKTVLDPIKYKSVSGLRIEAAGRLTRRNTAARAVFKLRYKGNIRNMDSSYKGLSTVLFRGYAKSNVQYTKLNSKLRIGSYGIKG